MKHLLVESFANCTCVNIWRSIARPSLRRKCNVRWRRVRQSGRAVHTCRKDGQVVIHKMRCRSSLLSRWKFGHSLIDAGKICFSRVFPSLDLSWNAVPKIPLFFFDEVLLLSSVWEMGKIWFRATNKIPFLYLLFFDEMLPVLFHNNILKIIWLISSLLLINY